MSLDLTYLRASDGTGDAALMHVTSDRAIGSTILNVDNVVRVPAKFIATSGTANAQGFIDPATATTFYGHVSGFTLAIDGFVNGSADVGNKVGQIVVIKPNTAWANLVADAIGVGVLSVIQKSYPVGSIYTNASNSTNPATLLGFGTWAAFATGRVPVGISPGESEFASIGQTGGSKVHAHGISSDGNHNHTFATTTYGNVSGLNGNQVVGQTGYGRWLTGTIGGGTDLLDAMAGNSTNNAGTHNHGGSTSNASTLPPYITVYMWVRTA